MAKFKLFRHSKDKEEDFVKPIQKPEEKQHNSGIKEKTSLAPIKEYNETLYSQGYAHKQQTTSSHPTKQSLKRITWENAETIEQNVDTMRMNASASTQRNKEPEADVDKKVDYILLKKKNRL